MKDKKGKPERTRKGERMYDFYFSDYFAYYICKDKGEEFQRLSTAGEPSADSITKAIFIFQIILHIKYRKIRKSKNKIFQKKFSFSKLFSILIMRDKRRGV